MSECDGPSPGESKPDPPRRRMDSPTAPIMTPARAPVRVRCHCRMVWSADGDDFRDECIKYTSGPDEPFCAECVAAGHITAPEADHRRPGE